MKLLTIVIFWITTALLNSNSSAEVNYNPRLLQKELSTLLSGQEFRMDELRVADSVLGNYKVNGKFFTILSREGNRLLAYVGRVHSCRAGGCSDQASDDNVGEFEFFDYFIIFDSQAKIKVVRIFNYEASHGQEIMARGWLKQFIGYDGTKPLRVGKEIDSISGATISACGITADIQLVTSYFRSVETAGRI